MILNPHTADQLCKRVVDQLATWSLLPAILQVGGIEMRGSSRIQLALEEWLLLDLKCHDLLVLPEYRLSFAPTISADTESSQSLATDRKNHLLIDYAIVHKKSVGQSLLCVDTVIEVKANFLCQSRELTTRPPAALTQANNYKRLCKANDAYVLYVVASPTISSIPASPRDAGWGYFRSAHPKVLGTGPINVAGVQVLGQHPRGSVGYLVSSAFHTQIWASVLTLPSSTSIVTNTSPQSTGGEA